ncbi:alpha/beta fold hydrolase [Kocuria koreensis]|jgi:pimeloyl-ACP methyl ester carboxylesterase|uniref:Alpha/beta fold hydrolase n=1 Tax=Rothia koreensis TaxID=592378 RepID=A0A7K1LJU5_9MICC|nr:alpha/beta fold hydrolase [Rothia koreensis]MUN55313.1 alpha/beta fold hydrolase [Rothia koreensis]
MSRSESTLAGRWAKWAATGLVALQADRLSRAHLTRKDVMTRCGHPPEHPDDEVDALSWSVEGASGLILFESGLGLPYECWDWMLQLAPKNQDVLVYNRSGISGTSRGVGEAQCQQRIAGLINQYSELTIIAHSIGSLVACELLAKGLVDDRVRVKVYLIDPTDDELMASSQSDRRLRLLVAQSFQAQILGSILGTSYRAGILDSDVNYRSSVERKLLHVESSPRTAFAGQREHKRFADNPPRLDSIAGVVEAVISAEINSDHNVQHQIRQRKLADRLSARHVIVSGSNHFSLIGTESSCHEVAEAIWGRSKC